MIPTFPGINGLGLLFITNLILHTMTQCHIPEDLKGSGSLGLEDGTNRSSQLPTTNLVCITSQKNEDLKPVMIFKGVSAPHNPQA